MAMPIFFLLNGLAVVFLLYVLVNFWKEGSGTRKSLRQSATKLDRRPGADVIVVTHPISHSAYGGISVMPLQRFGRGLEEEFVRRSGSREVLEMPVKRASVR